jgi:hypothetical protein
LGDTTNNQIAAGLTLDVNKEMVGAEDKQGLVVEKKKKYEKR